MNSTIVNYHVTQKLGFLNPQTGREYTVNEPLLAMSVRLGPVDALRDIPVSGAASPVSTVTLFVDSGLRKKNTVLMCLLECGSPPGAEVALVHGGTLDQDTLGHLGAACPSLREMAEVPASGPHESIRYAIFLGCEVHNLSSFPALDSYFAPYSEVRRGLYGDLFYTPFCEYMEPTPFMIKVKLPAIANPHPPEANVYENAVQHFHNEVRTSLFDVPDGEDSRFFRITNNSEPAGHVIRDNCFDCSYEKIVNRMGARGN